jgi:hypothetical protein
MGSTNHSANREVIITDLLITPGEGQSSGYGAQAQFNCDWATSLGNWCHPDVAIKHHQPYNHGFDIQNNDGVIYTSIRD